VVKILTETTANIVNSDTDGLPISDRTKQFRWLVNCRPIDPQSLLFATRETLDGLLDLPLKPTSSTNYSICRDRCFEAAEEE
jgi:hypothetical protein